MFFLDDENNEVWSITVRDREDMNLRLIVKIMKMVSFCTKRKLEGEELPISWIVTDNDGEVLIMKMMQMANLAGIFFLSLSCSLYCKNFKSIYTKSSLCFKTATSKLRGRFRGGATR